ncbi:MAG: fasciclin domain-containing protein [Maritimibacter sp.]
MKTLLKTTIAALALTTTTAFAESHGGMKSIVDIAAADDRFETLVAAVTAAGLGETLSGEGPFTVFAPTDDAFDALPEGAVAGLLAPDMKGELTDVLMYHVIPGKIMAADIPAGTMAAGTALEGASFCVTKGDSVMLDDGAEPMANVVIADIEASNGVIHVIDKVLMPGNDVSCM